MLHLAMSNTPRRGSWLGCRVVPADREPTTVAAANGGLGQNQLHGGKRIASVAIEYRKERQVFVGWLKALFFDCQRASLGKPRQGFRGAMQELTDVSTRFSALVTGQPLGHIGQHKLVTLFHGITTTPDLSQH